MNDPDDLSHDELVAEVVRLRTALKEVRDTRRAVKQVVADWLYAWRRKLLLIDEAADEAKARDWALIIAEDVVKALEGSNLVEFAHPAQGE